MGKTLWYRNSTSFYPRFAPIRVRVPAEKVKHPCPTEEDTHYIWVATFLE